MSEPLSCSQALLNEIAPITDFAWTDAFDKVVKDVLEQCRPGYVEIPTDAIHKKVSSKGLQNKLVGRRRTPSVTCSCQPHPHSAPPPEATATSLPANAGEKSAAEPATLSSTAQAPPSDDVTQHVVEEITERFAKASKPIVLIDACAGRFGMATTVRKLVEGAGIRFFESELLRLTQGYLLTHSSE